MNQSSKFWDKIADRYSKKPVSDEEAYQKKLQVTREYLRPDMEVLEFGCGTGSTAITHAPFVKHIQAIDISSRMIEIAQGKADAGKVENVAFERAAIDEFSAPDGTYDAVLGLSVLHLLESKEEVISKVHKMLKPGGIFVTSTPCLGDTMKFFKIIGPIGRFLGLMPLVKVFTKKELEDSLTDAGFEIDHRWQPGRGKAVFIVAKKSR
ncbi:MAG: class I SAM-dependent DNA methyltransferase [Planctomycetota bacterium]